MGFVDFGDGLYQWNAASKSMELAVRLAIVSRKVATGLSGLAQSVLKGSVLSGTAMPSFSATCTWSETTSNTSGLEFAVSPDAAALMVTVQLTGFTHQFCFLSALLGCGAIAIPPTTTTVMGEFF